MCPTSLFVLGLLHHGITIAAFPVVVPSLGRALASGGSRSRSNTPWTVDTHQTPSRLYARRRDLKVIRDENPNVGDTHKKPDKPGWRRRVLSKLRRKPGTLQAAATDETAKTQPSMDQIILQNFERLSPEQLFSTLEKSQYVLDEETSLHPFFETPVELPIMETNTTEMTTFHTLDHEEGNDDNDDLLLDCIVPNSVIGHISSFEGGPPIRKAVRNWFQNLLTNCFCEWSAEEPVNLQIRCSPTGNAFAHLLRGQLNCNARADFDRLVFDFIRLSGGSIEGSRLSLNLLAFTVDRSQEFKESHQGNNQTDGNISTSSTTTKPRARSITAGLLEAKKQLPRYLEQFDLHANDCILTQEDLFESSCVRNGLSNLVKRILKRRGIRTSSVVIDGIFIHHGKVSVKGEAKVKGVIPTRIAFEVRSGIEITHRGHVVNFPGLELSVNPDSGFFVPIPGVKLDIGHNAKLREVTLCGDKKQLRLSASVTITPTHTLKLGEAYTQSSASYSAKFSYDVGKWLTRIGRFSL